RRVIAMRAMRGKSRMKWLLQRCLTSGLQCTGNFGSFDAVANITLDDIARAVMFVHLKKAARLEITPHALLITHPVEAELFDRRDPVQFLEASEGGSPILRREVKDRASEDGLCRIVAKDVERFGQGGGALDITMLGKDENVEQQVVALLWSKFSCHRC